MKFLILTLLFSGLLQAEVLKKNADGDFIVTKSPFKVSEMLADYARIEGLNLSVAHDFEDASFVSQGTMAIKQAQMENYLTVLLSQSGNATIRMPGTQYLNVVSARDTRYVTSPVYSKVTDIPNNDHQGQFSYKLQHVEAAYLSRNLRPFIGRYGRIIDMKNANTIYITDSGNNLRKIAEMILLLDTEAFKKSAEEVKAINEKHKQHIKHEKSVLDVFTENSGLFIAAFFLIGLIIGFGSRGYMMKKVEGGW